MSRFGRAGLRSTRAIEIGLEKAIKVARADTSIKPTSVSGLEYSTTKASAGVEEYSRSLGVDDDEVVESDVREDCDSRGRKRSFSLL